MKKFLLTISLVISATFTTTSPDSYCADKVLFNFNEPGATGLNWPGWTWSTTLVSYDRPGWFWTNYSFINNVRLPRSFRKDDYGNYSLAAIDNANRAPSSLSGASMLIYDTGTGSTYQPSWWWQYDNNLGTKNMVQPTNDRLSMYVKLEGRNMYTNPDTAGYTFEWGTYTCWQDGGANGEDCPTESINGHWYHQTAIQPGAWAHILWDKHPSHRRGVNTSLPPNNPTMVESGMDYFVSLVTMYFQFQQAVTTPNIAKYWIDEAKFTSASEMGEPNQNDESITNIWVGYWPADKHWEIGWNDLSSYTNHDSKYEIRFSTSPITNLNWNSATIVTPLDYVVDGNRVHKSNTYKTLLWTRFALPQTVVAENSRLYFAVKDVSVAGGLYQNSPSPNIHTIDYSLKAEYQPPTNLSVRIKEE